MRGLQQIDGYAHTFTPSGNMDNVVSIVCTLSIIHFPGPSMTVFLLFSSCSLYACATPRPDFVMATRIV